MSENTSRETPPPTYLEATRRIYRQTMTDPQKIIKYFDLINIIDVIVDNQKRNAPNAREFWKLWLWGIKSYNALSFLNLNFVREIPRFLQDENGSEVRNPEYEAQYRKNFRKRALYGMVFELNRVIFVLGAIALSSYVTARLIMHFKDIEGVQGNLDFLQNKKFLLSVGILSLIMFISLSVMFIIKLRLQSRVEKLPLSVQFQTESVINPHENPEIQSIHRFSKVKFAVNLEMNAEIRQDNAQFDETNSDRKPIHKIRFGSKEPADNSEGFTAIKERPALHRSSILSKSGSYNLFYVSAITTTFGIASICLATLASQKSQKFAESTRHFFQNPQKIAIAALGILGIALFMFCISRLYENFAGVIRVLFKLVKDVFVEIFHALSATLYYFGLAFGVVKDWVVQACDGEGLLSVGQGDEFNADLPGAAIDLVKQNDTETSIPVV